MRQDISQVMVLPETQAASPDSIKPDEQGQYEVFPIFVSILELSEHVKQVKS